MESKALSPDGGLPASQGRAPFELHDFLHDLPPTAFGDQRVHRHQVCPGDLQVDRRLLVCLVFGVKNPLRRHLVAVRKLACLPVTRSSTKNNPLRR